MLLVQSKKADTEITDHCSNIWKILTLKYTYFQMTGTARPLVPPSRRKSSSKTVPVVRPSVPPPPPPPERILPGPPALSAGHAGLPALPSSQVDRSILPSSQAGLPTLPPSQADLPAFPSSEADRSIHPSSQADRPTLLSSQAGLPALPSSHMDQLPLPFSQPDPTGGGQPRPLPCPPTRARPVPPPLPPNRPVRPAPLKTASSVVPPGQLARPLPPPPPSGSPDRPASSVPTPVPPGFSLLHMVAASPPVGEPAVPPPLPKKPPPNLSSSYPRILSASDSASEPPNSNDFSSASDHSTLTKDLNAPEEGDKDVCLYEPNPASRKNKCSCLPPSPLFTADPAVHHSDDVTGEECDSGATVTEIAAEELAKSALLHTGRKLPY
jgi:hypothetical protein